jgi:hypothetical protein
MDVHGGWNKAVIWEVGKDLVRCVGTEVDISGLRNMEL